MSEPTSKELELAAELAQKDETIAILQRKVLYYERMDTMPPTSDLPTGDYTEDKREAELDMLRAENATMSSELTQIHKWMKSFDEKIDAIVAFVESDACRECPRRSSLRPPLSLAPGS